MKREQLKALGLAEEVIDSVMALHGQAMTALQSELSQANEKIKGQAESIKEHEKTLADLKKQAGAGSDLEKQIAEKQAELDAARLAHQKELGELRVEAALDAAIAKAKGKNAKAIKALLERDKIEVTESGEVRGIDLEAIKKTDPYLFESAAEKGSGFEPFSGAKGGSEGKDPAVEFVRGLFTAGSQSEKAAQEALGDAAKYYFGEA
jgi:hypothetical protein